MALCTQHYYKRWSNLSLSSGRFGFTRRMLYLQDTDVIMLKHIYIDAFLNTYSTHFIVAFGDWTHVLLTQCSRIWATGLRWDYFVRDCLIVTRTSQQTLWRSDATRSRLAGYEWFPAGRYTSAEETEEENVNTTEAAPNCFSSNDHKVSVLYNVA